MTASFITLGLIVLGILLFDDLSRRVMSMIAYLANDETHCAKVELEPTGDKGLLFWRTDGELVTYEGAHTVLDVMMVSFELPIKD